MKISIGNRCLDRSTINVVYIGNHLDCIDQRSCLIVEDPAKSAVSPHLSHPLLRRTVHRFASCVYIGAANESCRCLIADGVYYFYWIVVPTRPDRKVFGRPKSATFENSLEQRYIPVPEAIAEAHVEVISRDGPNIP